MSEKEAIDFIKNNENEIFIKGSWDVVYAAVVVNPKKPLEFAVEIGLYNEDTPVVLAYYLANNRINDLLNYNLNHNAVDFIKQNKEAILKSNISNHHDLKPNDSNFHLKLKEIDSYLFNKIDKDDLIKIGFSSKLAESIYKDDTYPTYSDSIELLNCGDESNVSNTKQKHLEGGVSISNKKAPDNFSGTLGGIFKMENDLNNYFITNAHVLRFGDCSIDNNIVTHPAVGDKGKEGDVGTIHWLMDNDILDAGIVKLSPKMKVGKYTRCGKIQFKGIGNAEINMKVNKCGRTTSYTNGTIRSINSTLYYYNSLLKEHVFMRNQIMTNCMAKPGDSGSLLADDLGNVVGLIFARNLSNNATFSNHFKFVFDQAENDLMCQPKISFKEFTNSKNN